MRVARREGEASLAREKKRGRPVGACRKLTLADEMWLREQIVGQRPQQLRLPFALWTPQAIKALIKERFGIEMQDRLIGKYLKRWGFTPQRPVKWALEQDPVKVKTWLEKTWPKALARARRKGAVVLWGVRFIELTDAPESNPDGYLNRDFETALRTGPISHDKASLLEKATASSS
jgi:transposase